MIEISIFAENGTLSYHEEIAVENRSGNFLFSEVDLSFYSLIN